MRTNTSATVYNRYRSADGIEFRRAHIPAVQWEPRKGANILDSGLTSADALRVYIPHGANVAGKSYIDPLAYAAKTPAKVCGYWTLSEGEDYIVRGDVWPNKQVLTEAKMSQLKASVHECFKITTVDCKRFGSPRMWHWEVGAR
jgi:hypothetical protein